MAVLKVARLGNPILRKIAKPVDLGALVDPDGDIQQLIDDMIQTMREEGGVGLAAPQVSRSLQIVVLECEGSERYPGRPDLPLMVLANPVFTNYSDEKVWGWESCLSLIDFSGWVPRSNAVTIEGYDRKGKRMVIEAEGFMAVVFQHEIDHLNGKLFIDRMPDLTRLSYQEEFKTYWVEEKNRPTEV